MATRKPPAPVSPAHPALVARVYLRVSTREQDLARQEQVVIDARKAGYYVAAVYREKASGARADRPELLRMIAYLQPGEAIIAEKIDRISRLPLPEAEQLVATIRAKGARLAVPGIVDLTELASAPPGGGAGGFERVEDIVLSQAMQMARDDDEDRRERQRQGIERARSENRFAGRRADPKLHERIVALRKSQHSSKETAQLAGCSESQVKRVWALAQKESARPAKPSAVKRSSK